MIDFVNRGELIQGLILYFTKSTCEGTIRDKRYWERLNLSSEYITIIANGGTAIIAIITRIWNTIIAKIRGTIIAIAAGIGVARREDG